MGADVINRYFSGQATESDVNQIKQLGSSINEENMNSVLKRMDDIANVKMGKQTYGEMNKAMKGMTASQKIDHLAQVMSSPEFKAHTQELMKTAQEQKAKAEGKKGVEGESTDSAIKENIKQEAVNSDNTEVKADNASVKNEGNTNNNINSADNSVQDETVSANENLSADKVSDNNADIKNDAEDKANVNNEMNDVFNKSDEALLNEGSNGIDTDNGLSENSQANNGAVDNAESQTNNSNINQESQNNAVRSENGIANGDETGYKGGEEKDNSEINKNIDEGLEHYDKILSYEPKITEFITDMASKLSMNIEGLEYRIKNKDSYLRKLTTIKSKDKIRDIIRYTYSASSDTLSDKILESIEEFNNNNYTTVNIYNTWNYKFYPYKGINTIIKTPDGIVFELQYHTPESYKLKNGELHKLYEKQRLLEDTSSDEYIELNNKMIELSNILVKPLGIERIINK